MANQFKSNDKSDGHEHMTISTRITVELKWIFFYKRK